MLTQCFFLKPRLYSISRKPGYTFLLHISSSLLLFFGGFGRLVLWKLFLPLSPRTVLALWLSAHMLFSVSLESLVFKCFVLAPHNFPFCFLACARHFFAGLIPVLLFPLLFCLGVAGVAVAPPPHFPIFPQETVSTPGVLAASALFSCFLSLKSAAERPS